MRTRITFSQALTRKYYQESKAILRYFRAINGDKNPDWNNLTKLFLNEFASHLSEQLSPNSARTYCAVVKSLLNMYSDEVSIPCKDYNKILSLKKVPSLSVYNTDSEIKLLIGYKPENIREHTIRNQYVLSCLTGMRHSDVIKIDTNNMLNDNIFYLSQKTMSLINTYSCTITEKLLKEGLTTIYSDPTFNTTIRSICKKVGINDTVKIVKAGKELTGLKYEYITSHTGRRSFATNLYMATKDLFLVSKLMGHSDVKITMTYICCDINDNKDVLAYFKQYQ